MGINNTLHNQIKQILKNSLRTKFERYNPEPASMPFHTRLLGKDRLALYKFIHSLNTNFGTTIFEPVAAKLAEKNFTAIDKQHEVGKKISVIAQNKIQQIMDSLRSAEKEPDKRNELAEIKAVCQSEPIKTVKAGKVDLYFESSDGTIYLFDLKTAKPNMEAFQGHKRKLLEWAAIILLDNPEAVVHTSIAIPYNPYEPKPYERWTMRGLLDLDNELKVGKEFWDFIGGNGAYEDLLICFEEVGIEMRDEIDEYFSRFRTDNKTN